MPKGHRPRVLLADDHNGILIASQRLLESSCDIVGRVTDGAAVLREAAKLKPDVIVLDIAMPQINGLDACRQIKQRAPNVIVVILTGINEASTRKRAFGVGASAFVLKQSRAEDLLSAIEDAMLGH